MVPADTLERAPAIRRVNGLVPEFAKIPGTVPAEQFKNRMGAGAAHQTADGGISRSLIPVLHRFDEGFPGFLRWRHRQFIGRAHRPVAFLHVLCLRRFEIIERPENRQPAVRIRRRQAREVRGVDHQHRMEFEADRPRLNVAHTGQQQGREQVAVTHTAPDFRGNFFKQPLARCVFEETNQRLHLRTEPNDSYAGFRGGNGRHSKSEVATQTQPGAGGGSRSQKMAPRKQSVHGCATTSEACANTILHAFYFHKRRIQPKYNGRVIGFTHDLRRGLSSGAASRLVLLAKWRLWRATHPNESAHLNLIDRPPERSSGWRWSRAP